MGARFPAQRKDTISQRLMTRFWDRLLGKKKPPVEQAVRHRHRDGVSAPDGLEVLHPTKGWRRVSYKRLNFRLRGNLGL